MCKAFSGIVMENGDVLWEFAVDSHETLVKKHGLKDNGSPRNWARFEIAPDNESYLSPDTWGFRLDEEGDIPWFTDWHKGECYKAHRAWLRKLNRILVRKPIVHPFKDRKPPKKITKKHLTLLRQWASVRDSVCDSAYASVYASVRDSVCDSVYASVRDSVCDSVVASVYFSVRDSAYASVRASVCDSAYASVCDSAYASVRDSVVASVRDSVYASVRDSVCDSVVASVCDSAYFSVRDSVYASVRDSVCDSVVASVCDSAYASVRASVVASVRDSVYASVRDSVCDSVVASVCDSAYASVRDSVYASVRDSVYASVGASVHAYLGSFFRLPRSAWKYTEDIKCGDAYPFQPAVDLWELGLVPSFDGKTWRLRGGKDAKVLWAGKLDDTREGV